MSALHGVATAGAAKGRLATAGDGQGRPGVGSIEARTPTGA